MIAGAAVLPAAPLLVPGVTATLPDGVPKVLDAIDAVVEALPPCDAVVLVAAGEPAVLRSGVASLAGIGRPDICIEPAIDAAAAQTVAKTAGYPLVDADELPLDLAVLALHTGGVAPVVPLAVPPTAAFDELSALGAGIAAAFAGPDVRLAIVTAGDLSAGLAETSPLHLVSGAIFFDEQAVAAVDSGRLDGLSRLGPGEANRVGGRAWAPLCVLHGATAAAKLGMVVRHYSAPRGVGYLVATGG